MDRQRSSSNVRGQSDRVIPERHWPMVMDVILVHFRATSTSTPGRAQSHRDQSTSIDDDFVRMFNLRLETNEILLSHVVDPHQPVQRSNVSSCVNSVANVNRHSTEHRHESTSTGDDYPPCWRRFSTDCVLSDRIEMKEKADTSSPSFYQDRPTATSAQTTPRSFVARSTSPLSSKCRDHRSSFPLDPSQRVSHLSAVGHRHDLSLVRRLGRVPFRVRLVRYRAAVRKHVVRRLSSGVSSNIVEAVRYRLPHVRVLARSRIIAVAFNIAP
jgi:hypothetical protein